ncbi:hypothetical protein DEO72_LG10g1807 [Vigna unguiculata]|uniref:Uncharacterized protein n=1 Tax=Vigna unguiculata TaxID=3917 RepID=A0A4D6NF70_VIGUN|nr:hypothetical protein DEO72_LG10g1807 [Vigna unguiculata]
MAEGAGSNICSQPYPKFRDWKNRYPNNPQTFTFHLPQSYPPKCESETEKGRRDNHGGIATGTSGHKWRRRGGTTRKQPQRASSVKPRSGRNPHVGKGKLALPVTRTGRGSGGINDATAFMVVASRAVSNMSEKWGNVVDDVRVFRVRKNDWRQRHWSGLRWMLVSLVVAKGERMS